MSDMKKGRQVTHVACIMDGNRRYARKNGLQLFAGHRKGIDKIKELFEWMKDFSIKEVTLYTFSTENFNRDPKEVEYLFDLFRRGFDEFIDDKRIHENKIKVNVVGRVGLFPQDIQDRFGKIVEKTKDYDQFVVNFALGYGGRQEIVDAVNSAIESGVKSVDVEKLSEYMYLQSEPDMVIRTGGDIRTSNFLVWQSVYAEWFFLDCLWPELTKEDVKKCLDEFSNRERRFGK